jgi:hypothetical protein
MRVAVHLIAAWIVPAAIFALSLVAWMKLAACIEGFEPPSSMLLRMALASFVAGLQLAYGSLIYSGYVGFSCSIW